MCSLIIPLKFAFSDSDGFQPFKLEHIANEQGAKWVFINPYVQSPGNDHFYICGINNMNYYTWIKARMFLPKEYNNKLEWVDDQIQHLFQFNINTLGWQCGYGIYDNRFYVNGQFTTENFWESVTLFKNLHNPAYGLPFLFAQDSIAYKHPYFPFIVNVNIIPNLQAYQSDAPGATVFQYLPDIWTEDFQNYTSILRAFLMCSDGEETYEQISQPMERDGVMVLPMEWDLHDPAGMRNQKALIFYTLGNDLYWWFHKDWNNFLGKRMWLLRIIWEQGSEPGKQAFAQAMKTKYMLATGSLEQAVLAWNQNYYPDFQISGFVTGDSENPDSLLQNQFYFTCQFPGQLYNETTFLEKINSANPPDETKTLGWRLDPQDAMYFVKELATKYYEIAVTSVRCFDKKHLIFTDRQGWCSNPRPQQDVPWDFRFILTEVASKHPDIKGFAWFRYCIIPEDDTLIPDNEQGDSFYSTNDLLYEMNDTYKTIENDEDPLTEPKPSVVVEWTLHGDWQKMWSYNWEGISCGNSQIPENLAQAPAPHGVPGQDPFCYAPLKYNFTETGIIYNDIYQGEIRAKHEDYEDFLYRFVKLNTGSPLHDHHILGVMYHGYYDLPWDELNGDPFPKGSWCPTQNWGLVNPKSPVGDTWSSTNDMLFKQYDHLINSLDRNNGCCQEEAGTPVWNKTNPDCNGWGNVGN